jgi:hypothetical protein
MRYFIIVLCIIFIVLLTFFTPTLIEDASFSTYDYLHNFRRTSQARDDDHPNDGWQKDGTFNPIHVIQETRPDGSKRILDDSRNRVNDSYNRLYEDNYKLSDNRDRDSDSDRQRQRQHDNDNSKKSETSDKSDNSETNLLPYLLLILLVLVIVIIAVKYNYRSQVNYRASSVNLNKNVKGT